MIDHLERESRQTLLSMVKGAENSMTTTTEHSTMIAVFVDREQANQAIDTLRHAGYSYDQIRLVRHGANSFVANLKSLFTGQTTATTDSADDWIRIGVPEQDAHTYQSELDDGRSIVLLKAVESPEQALGMLRQSGAFDIAFRLRTAPPTMAQGTVNPNVQAGTSNPTVAPVTNNATVPQETDAAPSQLRPTTTQAERNA
jgi:hypothetical protein